ncbi:MAG: hypothetical protein KJ941_01025 [Bacteroidetes bacterium]|nr:hypothetical protein [Bacteroidota bacterium]
MSIEKITKTVYRDTETNLQYQFEPVEGTVELREIERTVDIGDEQERREDTEIGFELKYLTQDTNPSPPDENTEDNNLFLVHYHPQFWVENDICPKKALGYIYTGNANEYYKDVAEQVKKDYWVFPVDAYIHSGVHLTLADGFRGRLPQGHEQFDVSHVGAILVKKKEFGAGDVEFENSKNEARTKTESLLEAWNQYLSGDVYCLVCETLDKDKRQIDYDIISGFYGFDYAKECLKMEI